MPPDCESIPQAVLLTQLEFHNVASKLEICVFPLWAGGAVSMTQKQFNKCKKQRKLSTKCLKKNALFPFWGMNYFSSVLPFLSAVQQGFMGAGVQVLSSQIAVEM